MHLADLRDGERRGVRTLAHCSLALERLDVDDDIGLGQCALHGTLDSVRRSVPLPDRGGGRDADDDVGEMPARGLPHSQAPQVDARAEVDDRLSRGLLRGDRSEIHEDVHVSPHEPDGGDSKIQMARGKSTLERSRGDADLRWPG